VLVNNAGFSLLGAVEDISDVEARSQMETNFFAPLNIIRHLLPGMRKQRSGTIVNISSTAGQVALPAVGIYAASKHALEGKSPFFPATPTLICKRLHYLLTSNPAPSESLSYGLAPLGIRVLILQPGGFNTNFASSIQSPSHPMTSDYSQTPVAAVLKSIPTLAGKQYGDTNKGCQAIFDMITKTGLAEG
jgi:short-subunit dehydrogenase